MKEKNTCKIYKWILAASIILCCNKTILSQQLINVRIIYIDPAKKIIALTNYLDADSNLSDWRVSSNGIDTPLSKLVTILGNLNPCKNTQSLVLQGLTMDPNKGSLSLHLPNLPIDSQSLHDFVQWGDSSQAFEADAVMKKIWRQGRYITAKPPFSFKCTYGDHDDTCWQGIKAPVINLRFAYVSNINNSICIKNAGVSNVDLSYSALCINGNCYDTIKNMPMNLLKGNLNILKNDSVVIQFKNDSILYSGSAALFAFPKLYNDTSVLLDFVQWGDSMQPYSSLAGQKGIWDSLQTVDIAKNDSIVYTGNYTFAQSGASYWETRHLLGIYLDEFRQDYVTLYPNPTAQFLNINSTISSKIYYHIIDITGKVMGNGTIYNTQQLDISKYANGIYYIKLYKDAGNPGIIKFVKVN
ncbi:MAG: T9SS type A sorting domain-containing protein [Bacteroidota bacterium]|nr:T9SS type A sorting domain-containing protein [Bacteroidota bacterium]